METEAQRRIAEQSKTLIGQLIGGLYLELQEKLQGHSVHLGQIHGEPAVRVNSTWVVVDGDKFKVVIPADTDTRRVLFECSISRPDDDFHELFGFLGSYNPPPVGDDSISYDMSDLWPNY